MTQTRSPNPDPDHRGHPDPDPGVALTPTAPATRTPARPDPAPGLGQGGTRPPTTRTRRGGVAKIFVDRGAPVPTRTTQTRTQTQTQTVPLSKKKALRAWMTKGGYLSALTVVVAIVAAVGQKVYAVEEKFVGQIELFGFDATPWFAPFVFDFAVAALLHGGINAARDRQSPWPWWGGATIVAGLSVYTNASHVGAQITASASAGLFVIWGLHLYGRYRKIVRDRQMEDVRAEHFLATDVLFEIDKRLAERALIITQTKPLDQAVRFRHAQGETTLTSRAVAILAARLYNDIFDDELYALMNPHRAARPAEGTGTDGADVNSVRADEDKVQFWQFNRRRRARRLAAMTAGDAVDGYLGLPVPNRRGIVPSRVTYAAPEPPPVIGIAPAPAPALPPAPPAYVDDEPRAVPAPPRRRAITTGRTEEPAGRHAKTEVNQPVSGAPSGMAGANWVPLHELVGLPVIDPTRMCKCHPDDPARYCGKTLEYHVQRRGKYIQQILQARPDGDWAGGERIGKKFVGDVCKCGIGTQNEIGWVFDQLRDLVREQRAAKSAGSGTIDGEVS